MIPANRILRDYSIMILRHSTRCLALVLAVILSVQIPLYAQTITVSGDYSPAYNGTDNPWNVGASLTVGDTGVGTMGIQDGAEVTNQVGYIGRNSGSMGEVTVTGGGSQWNSSSSLRVGESGSGTLNVENGGVVSNTYGYVGRLSTSTGAATVTGIGSEWNSSNDLSIGSSGANATLNVEAGGVVLSSRGYIGAHSTATGTGTATVKVTGAGSQWNNTSTVYVRHGSMQILDSAEVTSSSGFIALNAGTTGSVTVDGAGSSWTTSGGVILAEHGTGVLNVTNGGSVSGLTAGVATRGGTGTATVDGAGSKWISGRGMTVGSLGGDGTLNIKAGGLVTNGIGSLSQTTGSIGSGTGSIGRVTVDGTDSRWTNADHLHVADQGNGELNITNGGTTTSRTGYIALNAGTGVVNVQGVGSKWENEFTMEVGKSGTGTLNIKNGGFVSTGSSIVGRENGGTGTINIQNGGRLENTDATRSTLIGYDSGSTGTVNVTGAGSTLTSTNYLYVGLSGTGHLDIQNAGLVTVTGDAFVGASSSGTGTVTVAGGGATLSVSDGLAVGGTTSSASGTGTLNIQNGGSVVVGDTLKVWGQGTVNMTGGTLDVGTLDYSVAGATFNMTGGELTADMIMGDFVQNGGVLMPGDSPGLTSFTRDYTLNAGSIEFELAGMTRGTEFDALDLAGMAMLDGTMDINLLGGFMPTLGDSFWLINAGSYSGTPLFDFSDAMLTSGLEWDTSMFMTNGSLLVVSAVPEPGSVGLLCLACCGFGFRRKRRDLL